MRLFLCLPMLACALLTCGSDARATQNRLISITDYGAVPGGNHDATGAINAAIAAARLRGRAVLVPAGVFRHRSFSLTGVTMVGEGPASVLLAPNSHDSNIYLRGSSPQLRDLAVRVESTKRDAANFAIYIDHAVGAVVEDVAVDGGNAGGIFNFGGSGGRIVGNSVQNTLADAIHNTNGAHDILIANNRVRNAGDDMIAVVSYSGEIPVRNILIRDNDLANSNESRGISVVGGHNITIVGNVIARTGCCAGIYLASEASYKTQSVRDVVVRDNVLIGNSGRTQHGAIMLFADNRSVRSISIAGNTIIDARHSAIRLLGNVSGVTLLDNRLIRPADQGIDGRGHDVHCAGNTLNGRPADDATCDSAREVIHVTGATLQEQ